MTKRMLALKSFFKKHVIRNFSLSLGTDTFDPVLYWSSRADRHGVRSILNLGHKKKDVEAVTRAFDSCQSSRDQHFKKTSFSCTANRRHRLPLSQVRRIPSMRRRVSFIGIIAQLLFIKAFSQISLSSRMQNMKISAKKSPPWSGEKLKNKV